MILKENCEGWKLKYEHDSDSELTEESKAVLTGILHTTGDAISFVLSIPEEQADIRASLFTILQQVFAKSRQDIEESVSYAMMELALNTPPEPGFTDEDLFGISLVDQIKKGLTEDEIRLIDDVIDGEEEEPNEPS